MSERVPLKGIAASEMSTVLCVESEEKEAAAPKCQTCRHWLYIDGYPWDDIEEDCDDLFIGECRRHPPLPHPGERPSTDDCPSWYERRFPITLNNCFCGEWRGERKPAATSSVMTEDDLLLLDLGTSIHNRLRSGLMKKSAKQPRPIESISMLASMCASEVRELAGIGQTSLNRIRIALRERGLKLRGD